MRPCRFLSSAIFVALLAVLVAPAVLAAEPTKITVGAVAGFSSEHFPTYVAIERGFFKKEGLDAKLVALNGGALKTAGLAGQVDFIPLPTAAALAALHGAPVQFVVGESRSSQWALVAGKKIAKPEDLKGLTIAYGQPGTASYDEGERVLSQFFHMSPGKDYKVISFQRIPDEVAALANGTVQAALLTTADAVRAEKDGYKDVLNTGTYLPRLGGEIWTLRPFVEQHPDAVKAFIRAMAEAIMYIRDNKQGTMPIFKTYLGIDDAQEQSRLWDLIHDGYDAALPPKLFRDMFEARRRDMISMGQWPKDKPLPDVESFVARKLLADSLEKVHYVPLPAKTN